MGNFAYDVLYIGTGRAAWHGEMINILAMVINGRMTMEMMMGTIWAFPTQVDGLTEMLAPMLHSNLDRM